MRDSDGERVPFAYVQFFPDSIQTTTSQNGQFTTHVTQGEKTIVISHVGFRRLVISANIQRDTTFRVVLYAETDQLNEIVITAERDRQQELFESNQTSKHVLTQENIKALPVLGGEADVIKALQLLPGTIRGVEGSSDLFVRGGAADQNLVLLDNVPIYNSSHLFGFLSVFNPDILDQVESINGGFPAEYGGRLSSVLNVKTRNNVVEKTALSVDVGLLASRMFIEQPIVKEKASVWIAARRTYVDQVVRAIGEELPYYFYDLNGKVVFNPKPADAIAVSYFSGEDILDLFRDRNGDGDGFLTRFQSGNSSQSLEWTRNVNPYVTSTISLMRTRYQYNIQNAFEENELAALSAWRQFDEINSGNQFPSRYDRRHNGALVMQYALTKRLAASMVWEYISGARFTPVVGQYVILAPTLTGVDLIPVYSGVNEVRLADTHRLDVGLKWHSKPNKRFQWQWFVGVYNTYNRANPIGITIEQDDDGTLRYEQPGLFGLLPFISYGFKL